MRIELIHNPKNGRTNLLLNGEMTTIDDSEAIKKAQEWTSNQIDTLASLGRQVVIIVKEK